MPTDILLISETVVVNVALAYGTNGAHLGQQLADSLGSQTNGQSYGTGGINNAQQLSNSLGSQTNSQSYGTGGTNNGQQISRISWRNRNSLVC